ncbi:hypothetical protein ACWD1Y_11715 [Streptomyces sp. NPDC002814]
MSDSEQPEQDLRAWAARMEAEGESDEPEVRITTFDSPPIPVTERASRVDHPAPSWQPAGPEQREGRVARQEQPVPPGDRLAHLGHIEHPVEMYTVMKPVPNTMPMPDDADEWVAAFGRVIAGGNLPGGDGKTSSRPMIVDTDPPGSVYRWELRPEIKGMMCGEPTEFGPCRVGIGDPAPNCPSISNHQAEG